MTSTAVRPALSVGELRRAWSAIERGAFRVNPAPATTGGDTGDEDSMLPRWEPHGTVIPVLGALPQCGATTTALAIATTAGSGVVIECASAATSGLTSAATAEHGTSPSGWTIGRRDQVWIARASRTHRGAESVPVPDQQATPPECGVRVVDLSWDLTHVLATPSWVQTALLDAPSVVVVSAPSVPGVRRLEAALRVLADRHLVVGMVGSARRRWPRHVSAATGPLTRRAIEEDRTVSIALDKHLATHGLDDLPLRGPLLAAAAELMSKSMAAAAVAARDPNNHSERPR